MDRQTWKELFFWVLSLDLSQAWVVSSYVFERAPKEVRRTRYTDGERFAIIPIEQAHLIDLKGDRT